MKTKIKSFKSYLFCALMVSAISCSKDKVDSSPPTRPVGFNLEHLAAPSHYPGIPVFTADMSKNKSTELNSEWVVRQRSSITTSSAILRNGFNSLLKINFDGFSVSNDYVEFVVAISGKLTNRAEVPAELLSNVNGISFRAVSYDVPVELSVQAIDINDVVISTQKFTVRQDAMKQFNFAFNAQNLHHLSFKINGNEQISSGFKKGALAIDDIYLTNNNTSAFTPPVDDTAFLKWLKESSLRYFLWQYRTIDGNRSIVLESYEDDNKVSLSGIGYSYAAFILAAQEGMITESSAKQKITAILKWQQAQNWNNGSEGKFGFPLHYYNANGTGKYPSDAAAISTIDWAICAAGIRVVRQKYISDPAIVSICDALLDRPQWQEVIANNPSNTYELGRIVKGLKATTGEKSSGVWADAFSEETELIYLEALASGKVNNLDLTRIFRQKKQGFYVSWFGCGFTYNWLQLWTGPQEPYYSNSVLAYQQEAITANSRFGKPLMGLTACATLSGVDSNGFINWNQYISNQGSSVSGATTAEVIQISPAPYGAALALPFQKSLAISALREYVKLGFYHPLLGLPDNVRVNNLPSGLNVAVPNWNPFDINIGPMAMGIEQIQQNTISNLYLNDNQISTNLTKLKGSF
jgi:hypothetical protein